VYFLLSYFCEATGCGKEVMFVVDKRVEELLMSYTVFQIHWVVAWFAVVEESVNSPSAPRDIN